MKIANRLHKRPLYIFTMKKIALYLIFAVSAIVATAQTRFDVDGLTYEILSESDRTVEVHDGSNASGELSIPETVSYNGVNYTVTSISEMAFSYCEGLTAITIPNSVVSIGERAFSNSHELTMINVDKDNRYYKSIDGVLFDFETTILIQYPIGNSRTTYIIPNSVTSIGDFAFLGCEQIISAFISDSVTKIGRAAFSSCEKLATITISDFVTSIGDSAFSYCDALTTVIIPNSVTSIGNDVFFACDGLTSVVIPNSVTSIGDSAFYSCDGLTTVTIPNSVTYISGSAFSSCSGLTMFNVDNENSHYKSIDGVLFNFDVTKLIQYPIGNSRKTYVVPNSVITIEDGAFKYCRGLTTVTIPNSVVTIDNAAFSSCRGLTSITIPATTIGDLAFFDCEGLTTIALSNSVTSIGSEAFSWCSGLQEVINLAEEPQRITSDVFSVVQLGNVRLIVPSSSVEKYKNADVWKDFGTIEGQDAGVGTVETDKIVVSGGVLRNPEGDEIRIYDLNGREMYSGNGSELRLPTGLYILQTSNGSRKVVF